MLVTGQKLLASEQIKYSAFLVLFWYLETGQEIHQLKKFNDITIKVRANIYLFIYLLFIYYHSF